MDTVVDGSQTKRLIAIMPEGVTGRIDLARRIHWMAVKGGFDVLYLELVDQPEDMLARSRSMVTLRAMISDPGSSTDWELIESRRWFTRLNELVQPGDAILCHAEQTVKVGAFKTVPLSDLLQEKLHTSVRTVSGYYQPQVVQIRQWGHSLIFWIGVLVILAGFAFLDIRLHLTLQGIERKVLLILAMLLEVAAVWTWNRIMDRRNTE
jgi:hypothetical protein